MNTQIEIKKINESFAKITCVEKYMEMEIQDKFSFEVPDARHDPRVKAGRWDGIKKLYNRRDKTFPIGLTLPLLKFIKAQGYSYKVDPALIPKANLSLDDLKNIVEELIQPHDNGKPITLYEHQYDALMHILNLGRTLSLSSTSSGKSLIIYCAIRVLQLVPEMEDKKIMVVVPSGNLVEQMYSDFENYANGADFKWNTAINCQKISKDYKKSINKQVVITTWQSMSKLPRYALDDMKAMFVDECFHPDTPILTIDGEVPIKDIKIGDKIINYSEKEKSFKTDVVVDVYENMKKSFDDNILELEFDNGKIMKVTENHKILTNNGWIKAKDLNTDHNIINIGT